MASNSEQQFLRPLLYPGNPAASVSSTSGSHAASSTYRRPPVPRCGTYGTMNMSTLDVEKRPLAVAVTVEKEELMPRSLKKARKRRVLLSVMWLFASVFIMGFVLHSLGIPPCREPNLNSTPNGLGYAERPPPETTNTLKTQPKERQIQASVTTSSAAAAAPERTVLRNFEVAPPVLMPYGPADSDGTTPVPDGYNTQKACEVLLMRRDFAFSYGDPYIGQYTPPSCKFNRVVMNFTVVSEGRQYDRLALMYLGDTEIWRTSTAEPVAPPGISWTYLKDTTQYLSLWLQPQKIIFDLGNLVNDKYTGIFNTTLTATFFWSDVPTNHASPSDLIIPISARQSSTNGVSQFTLPLQNATNTISDFPLNARRAVFSVSANGQAGEEFWWSNVLQSDSQAFDETVGELPGLSPFREVQLLIDGQLAGVYWPFPVIFTGGVVPSLHRPVAGVEAFDLKEHEIDITPWLGVLTDGGEHVFEIRVVGVNDTDGKRGELTERVEESWYVTGKIFVWTAAGNSSPSIHGSKDRKPPTITGLKPSISLTSIRVPSKDTNSTTPESITYTTTVTRSLLIRSPLGSWSQTLSYTNKGLISAQGYNQLNDMLISGTESSSSRSSPIYQTSYTYPLFANSSYSISPTGNLSIWGHLVQGKTLTQSGAATFPDYDTVAFNSPWPSHPQTNGNSNSHQNPGKPRYRESRLETKKEGEAWYQQTGDGKNSTGNGDSKQRLVFNGLDARTGKGEKLYFRDVEARGGKVVRDLKRMAGREVVVGGFGISSVGEGGDDMGMGVFGGVPETNRKGDGKKKRGGR
ncbi:peptide N-acetyl-beta-D-glucosaminyl asparaginase amidase A-domain-containing protein [Sordaria brevicollis]|uniref:Peptide N-acetyl-beta-D-glucosaminyl asparaginase amidase A-domain-containing protein n=1 Tax=Sordaria brevicollis TaxID=83679 RepID=A0AAE0UG27_SORBR|nr:peptide N-acetyl-beta-D-glucosaminyl asparaginase amidase A-domain-containing protein [Sordaria brevicollis]